MTTLVCKQLGCNQDYTDIWKAMQKFTDERKNDCPDELWLLEHPAVFTLGRAGRPEHILNAGDIPVIHSDRGGQVTYHGPGQLVFYPLFNLNRLNISIREFVTHLENIVIRLLSQYGITGQSDKKAPGVYIEKKKIASIGLRIRRQCNYHGVSININNDLAPFNKINTCGYEGLEVARLDQFVEGIKPQQITQPLIDLFAQTFDYQSLIKENMH